MVDREKWGKIYINGVLQIPDKNYVPVVTKGITSVFVIYEKGEIVEVAIKFRF